MSYMNIVIIYDINIKRINICKRFLNCVMCFGLNDKMTKMTQLLYSFGGES